MLCGNSQTSLPDGGTYSGLHMHACQANRTKEQAASRSTGASDFRQQEGFCGGPQATLQHTALTGCSKQGSSGHQINSHRDLPLGPVLLHDEAPIWGFYDDLAILLHDNLHSGQWVCSKNNCQAYSEHFTAVQVSGKQWSLPAHVVCLQVRASMPI